MDVLGLDFDIAERMNGRDGLNDIGSQSIGWMFLS
jgi:hypothetical protein